MHPSADGWYVRLPDGRVFRAASTEILRHHLMSGKVPLTSWVRRSPDDEWITLEWSGEFIDLAPVRSAAPAGVPPVGASSSAYGEGNRQTSGTLWTPFVPAASLSVPVASGVASHLDPLRMQQVGVHSLLQEILAAWDSTLVRSKLAVAAVAGLLTGSLAALVSSDWILRLGSATFLCWTAAALAILLIAALCISLLTQMTYVELANLRPARWRESTSGLRTFMIRLTLAYLLVVGGTVLLLSFLSWLPHALLHWEWSPSLELRAKIAEVAVVVGMVLQIVLWSLLGFALLLGPIIVVEQCSMTEALIQWTRLLRQHLGKAFLYEILAVTLAGLVSMLIALPLVLAVLGTVAEEPLHAPIATAVEVLAGLAAAPGIAYLAVANVFIYLNLRYESAPRR